MIPPYIGAIVHYYPIGDDDVASFTGDYGPKAAMIVGLHMTEDYVDLVVFVPTLIAEKAVHARTNVPHRTPSPHPEVSELGPHWEWIHTAALANAKAASG